MIKCLSLNERMNPSPLSRFVDKVFRHIHEDRALSFQDKLQLFFLNIYTEYEIKIYDTKKSSRRILRMKYRKSLIHICPYVFDIHPSLFIDNFFLSLLSITFHILPVEDSKSPPLNNLIKDSLITRSVPPPRGYLAQRRDFSKIFLSPVCIGPDRCHERGSIASYA